jgi:antitoxin (DNA-binding transcriptional repressor) of toxin-antitoxin stability system
MERASVSGLKSRLGEYPRKFRAGETVLVLDRGKPVANLEPSAPGDDRDGWMASLIRERVVKPPVRPLPARLVKFRPPKPRGGLIESLLDERREGR